MDRDRFTSTPYCEANVTYLLLIEALYVFLDGRGEGNALGLDWVDPQSQHIRARILAHGVTHMLGQTNLLFVVWNFGHQDALLSRRQWVNQRRPVRAKYHRKSACASGGREQAFSFEAEQFVVLVGDDLGGTDDERLTFHGGELGDAIVGLGGRMVGEREFDIAWTCRKRRPTGHVNLDPLGVRVVTKQGLDVLPAVQAADLDVFQWRIQGQLGRRCRDHGGE